MKEFVGKTAVVTGAASGFGLALATRFLDEKMNVVLADYDDGPLQAAAASLSTRGRLLAIKTDVSDGAQVAALAERARAEFGNIHIVCNNAGVGGGGGPLWAITENDWRWVLGVNLWGVIHGLRAFVPSMIAHGEPAHIVNTASLAGLLTPPFMGDYVATKHAVVAMSETLARDLQAFGSTIKVSVLCPGFVQTGIADSAKHRPAHLANPKFDASPTTAARGMLEGAVKQLVANGKPVSVIPDAVMAAIRAERFHILTHDELVPLIEQRFTDVLQQRYPKYDPTDLMPRKNAAAPTVKA